MVTTESQAFQRAAKCPVSSLLPDIKFPHVTDGVSNFGEKLNKNWRNHSEILNFISKYLRLSEKNLKTKSVEN